jgi:hypothetical protein
MERRAAMTLVVALIVSASPGLAREPRRDPSSGQIRLKYIGDCLAAQTPTRGMELDPLISLGLVPASTQEWAVSEVQIIRYMRLYMPRTLDHLLDTTDVVMLSNAATYYFRPEWIEWLATGTEGGVGLQMIGGYCSFGGYGYPDWGPTAVGDKLPVETIVANAKRDFPFRLGPVVDNDPLLSTFDWQKGPMFFGVNNVKMRQGARLLATTEPGGLPLLAYQDVEKGSVLAFMSSWGLPWGDEFVRWEYFIDFSADMVYYSAGLEIPDPVIVHQIRILFERHELDRRIVRSLLDFVDKMGGRASKVHESLAEIDLRRTRAEELYKEQDYPECREEISSLVDDMAGLNRAAIKAKDAAFLWIYLTEWSAVTATGIISGYFLYVVMVRRRLLKEVASTTSSIR